MSEFKLNSIEEAVKDFKEGKKYHLYRLYLIFTKLSEIKKRKKTLLSCQETGLLGLVT